MSKLCWSTLTGSVVLATALLSSAYPVVQTPSQGQEQMGATLSPEGHLQLLSEKVNLSEEQKAKLKAILQGQAQQLMALRDDPSLSPEQKSAKKQIIHELTHDQINNVLTPEQQDKFKQMKQDAMDKHQEMNH
jgi:Spy/CpxP family protein refolding chaperone